jgi:Secretion system C-terminal sorting domain
MKNTVQNLLLTAFICLFSAIQANAQACQPDARYRDSLVGVYPSPVTATNPNGGITKAACIGKTYSFTFTVKISDSIDVPTLGKIPLDSLTMATSGAVGGMPAGLTYACNPANCIFKKSTTGCVIIQGTPTTSNTVKSYPLVITGKAFSSNPLFMFGFPNGYTATFPGPLFPGEYNLKLLANNDPGCVSATNDLKEVSHFAAMPNPTNGKTIITIESSVSGNFEFTLTNVMGQSLEKRSLSIQAGINAFEFDASRLPNGVYIYALSKGSRVVSNKLIVNN